MHDSLLLLIKNHCLFLSSTNTLLLKSIDEVLTFTDNSKAFINGVFDKNRVKIVKFVKFVKNLDLPTISIPIGFLEFVLNVIKDYNHKIVDERPYLKDLNFSNINIDGVTLYDHQVAAIEKALKNRRGIIMSPTGSGKTEIFLALIKVLEEPTLIVFNRTQLAHQTMERAKSRGIDVGIVQGKNVLEKKITIATIQSIEKLSDIRKYKNLIIDEVHNSSSNSYQSILKLKHWYRVYGFSATPVNPNKMDLQSAKIISTIGPVIFEVKPNSLIEKGLIAKPTIVIIDVDKPSDIYELSYKEAELVGIVYNDYRNKIIRDICLKHRDDKVLVLTKYIDQGREIQKLLPEGTPFIWNEIDYKERMRVLKDFENGIYNILISSRILDEGIDIKNFGVLVIASAGNKFTKTIQRLGRGLRVTEKKKNILIYDFMDKTQFNLLSHSKNRIKFYKLYGYNDIKNFEGV